MWQEMMSYRYKVLKEKCEDVNNKLGNDMTYCIT